MKMNKNKRLFMNPVGGLERGVLRSRVAPDRVSNVLKFQKEKGGGLEGLT